MKAANLIALAFAMFSTMVLAKDVDCADSCFSDISMTACSASDWACLCKDPTYVDVVNTCVMTNCNTTSERNSGYYTLYQICLVSSVTLSGPESSAAVVASLSTISGVGATSALFSAISTSLSQSPATIIPTAPGPVSITSGRSTASGVAQTSITPGGPISGVSATPSASANGTLSAASTLTSANPGGPLSATSSSGSGSAASTLTSITPGGPVQSASSSTSASSTASASGNAAPGSRGQAPQGYALALLGMGAGIVAIV